MKNGHLIKSEKLTRSAKWRQIPDETTRWVYCVLIGAVDSWGMMPADECTIKAVLAPLTDHSGPVLTRSILVLTRIGLLRTWTHQGAPWLLLENHSKNQKLTKRKKNPDVPIPDKSEPVVTGRDQSPCDVDFNSDLDGDGEATRETPKPSPPPSQPPPEPTPRPTRDPIDVELSEIVNAFAIIWKLAVSDIPTPKDDHRLRWAQVLGDPKIRPDAADRYKSALLAIRGHYREATKEGSQIGKDLRHVVPEARKGGRGQSNRLDVDRYMAYVRAGGRQKQSTQAPNMQSPEPSELAAQMEVEAIAEHKKYCKENGVDPNDAAGIRKLASAAERTRRAGSGPSKAFK